LITGEKTTHGAENGDTVPGGFPGESSILKGRAMENIVPTYNVVMQDLTPDTYASGWFELRTGPNNFKKYFLSQYLCATADVPCISMG